MYAYIRALKTKGNTPKYGLLYHSSFIGRAGTKNKGRISRFLANKCTIASRIDCFIGNRLFYLTFNLLLYTSIYQISMTRNDFNTFNNNKK